MIDRSSDIMGKLSDVMRPEFNEEQLFLNGLVEGKASLYLYEDGNIRRYFYQINDAGINQLIYKRYMQTKTIMRTNNQYKQQLWNELTCTTVKKSEINKSKYGKTDLVPLFIEYNKCSNSQFEDFYQKRKKDLFNLTIRDYINYSSLKIDDRLLSSSVNDIDFESSIGYGFGLEVEFVLPFNKSKWAIIVEPSYQSFSGKGVIDADNVTGGKLIVNVNYSSYEIQVGLRHYFFINDKSKIMANIAYVIDLSSRSSILFTRLDHSLHSRLSLSSKSGYVFGLGYKYNDIYSVEMRSFISKGVLTNYAYWNSNYNTFSIVLGYSFL